MKTSFSFCVKYGRKYGYIKEKKEEYIYIKENGYTIQNVSLWVFYTVLYTDFAIGIWIFYEFLWPKEHPRDFFFFFNAR